MEVKLIAKTIGSNGESAELVCGSAARGCYSVNPSMDLIIAMNDEKMQKTLSHAIEGGHTSVLEHMQFTFSVEGVSRVLTHQLVRHRIGFAFSQQSMRYVDVHKLWDHMIIPERIQEVIDDEFILSETRKDEEMANAIETYRYALSQLITTLDKHGIPSEDIRYFVPNGVKANITVTMNGRAALNFCALRCCTRAQKEIRELANAIAAILKEECPYVFQNIGASCVQKGYCPEKESCGRAPTIIQLKEAYNRQN